MILRHHSTQVFITILNLIASLLYLLIHIAPSTSAYPSTQPSPPVFQMTPSVPFAPLANPVKILVGLDQMYPPEKFFAHLNARVAFQSGPQHRDIQKYSTRMSLLHCSLTGSTLNWIDRLPQFYKKDWSSSLLIFEKKTGKNMHTMLISKRFRLFKKMLKMYDIIQ